MLDEREGREKGGRRERRGSSETLNVHDVWADIVPPLLNQKIYNNCLSCVCIYSHSHNEVS